MVDYSIVVPAYNEEAWLPRCLGALRAAMAGVAAAGEIVVCDNNSTDRTAEVARAAGALCVFEPKNQISRARNTGARAARGRYLVFVDADTQLPEGLLAEALARLESGRVCGGGALIGVDEDGAPDGMLRALALWNRISRRMQWAAGSFVFVRRDAFDEVGGFSEKVYASEELWLSRELRRWGRRHGQVFTVIEEPKVRTSARKAEWFSAVSLVGTFLLFTVFPPAVRSRRLCRIWYRRPGAVG